MELRSRLAATALAIITATSLTPAATATALQSCLDGSSQNSWFESNGVTIGVWVVLDQNCSARGMSARLDPWQDQYGHFAFWGANGPLGNSPEDAASGYVTFAPQTIFHGSPWCARFWKRTGADAWRPLIEHCQ
ncbi:hypothetical protein [Allokutzneria albata]|uniref:Uncharacterized protein n=1 Tax=Allokutzneria albata TaxID=211114 RepID=A0A1G9ZBF4_ALLAB|nr:hypothetical protein [Allokutzneria albata]SDN18465.1 hypothetical protein SAMN04489726_5386 [Allokutzneria albata]